MSRLRGLSRLIRVLRTARPVRAHSSGCSSHDVSGPSQRPSSTHTSRLPHRALVRVAGKGAPGLLQGLVTADVSLLQPLCSQYSMMLNAQGRVLYDLILYRPAQGRGEESTAMAEGEHLLECDANAASNLVKLLKRYALRAEVDISQADPELQVWATYPGAPSDVKENSTAVILTQDPRVAGFGSRVIVKGAASPAELWDGLNEVPLADYHTHRLQMGIAEGIEEIPPGNCFPLEYNLDYLNGVSFDKGCYVGQELTARTHHTGVVRKRVLPVTLASAPSGDVPIGTVVRSSVTGKSAGKLVCHRGQLGLALLRLQEVAKGGLLLRTEEGEEVGLTPHTPPWWPE